MIRWRPGQRPSPIGLQFDGQFVTAAQLAGGAKGPRLLAGARLPRRASTGPPRPEPAEGRALGEPLNAAEVEYLCQCLPRQGFRGRRVVVGVPGETLRTGVLDLPPRDSGAPVDQIARAELARMHDYDPESAEIASWDLPPSPRAKAGAQVMALACRHADAEALLDVIESAGLDVVALDARPQALLRACRTLLSPSGITAIADLGWDQAWLILGYQGVITYQRMVPESGLGRLTASLAKHLDLEEESARYLLREVGLARRGVAAGGQAGSEEVPASQARPPDDAAQFEAVTALVRVHLEAIGKELEATLAYGVRQYPGAATGCVLLTGCGAGVPGTAEYFSSRLHADVRTVTPAQLVQCPPALAPASADPSLVAPLGLAEFE